MNVKKRRLEIEKISARRILCFGSRIPRDELTPLGSKPRDYPGPFEHYFTFGLMKKSPNKIGYTLFASNTSRDKTIGVPVGFAPPVGTYEIGVRKPAKPNPKPFGVGEKLSKDVKWVTPAPGTYSFFKRNVRVCTAFGHDRIIVPMARIICSQFNMSYCSKCEQTPIGDYWHKDSTNQDMCRPCMENEWKDLKKCATKVLVRHRKKLELRMFTLVRYCQFYHEHHCTKAAVQMMSTKDLKFKLRKENYLFSFGL